MSNSKFKKEKGTNSPTGKPTCGKCCNKHYGDCLKGMNNCFCFGKSRHKVRDFPNVRIQEKDSGKTQASGSNEASKKNRFYSLHSRGEQETSFDMVTGMLKVFSINVYFYLIRDLHYILLLP